MGRLARLHIRRGTAKKLRAPVGAEHRYTVAIRGILRGVREKAMAWLAPKLGQIARQDAPPADGSGGSQGRTALASEFQAHVERLSNELAPSVAGAFAGMSTEVIKKNTQAMRSLGLDVRGQLGPHLAEFREWSQSLIKDAAHEYGVQVAGVLNDPFTWGLRQEEIAALLKERGDVSDSRAKLIARDQTSKLNSSINSYRQRSAGVTAYEWSTSQDERVRDTHAANEGKVFQWGNPPVETGDPGDDVNCRCVAVPVIPELGDDEESGAAPAEPETEAGGGGAGGDEPPEPPAPPEETEPEPEPEPKAPELEEGVHADEITVRRGVDQELVDHALRQPQAVLDALAGRKVGTLTFQSAKVSKVNQPGKHSTWLASGRTEIIVNTQIQPLIALRGAQNGGTMSTKLAVRAADAVVKAGGGAAAEVDAATRAKIRGTLTHEIGHQLHGDISAANATATDREVDAVVHKTFAEAKAANAQRTVSDYSDRNHFEFFAEAFTAYHHAPELLDTRTRAMVEKVVSLRKGKP